MNNSAIPFSIIDWNGVQMEDFPGETGIATWQTVNFGGLRIRIVEYSAGYVADHWCRKGHIVYCLEGEFVTELESGDSVRLTRGMTYVVSDGASSHRSIAKTGAKLLIVDGDLLSEK